MKLLIIGATGSIGRQLLEQSLEQGHEVTVLVRNPDKLTDRLENLNIVQGDVLNPADVRRAVQNQDAVICALGAGRHGNIRAEGTRNIIGAMESAGVQRIICLSSLGVGDSQDYLNFFWKYIMFGMLLREAYADHVRQEEYLRQSQLDWTIVRPGSFIDGDRTGQYQHGFPASAKQLKLKISRADVAEFMLKQLRDNVYWHKTPALSY